MGVHVDIDELRVLYVEQNMTLAATAQALGVSSTTVWKRLRTEEIPGRTKAKLDTQEVRRLYVDEDRTLQQIAHAFGVSRQAVQERLIKAGVDRRRRDHRRKETAAEIRKKNLDLKELRRLYVEMEMTISALSEQLGLGHQAIRLILESEGIAIRSNKFYAERKRKYPELYDLKIGDEIEIELPEARYAEARVRSAAVKARINVSIKTIAPGRVKVTRLA
ncbi:MAG: hypothetical protein ABJB40_09695 [Acidobacteriota bacterium]